MGEGHCPSPCGKKTRWGEGENKTKWGHRQGHRWTGGWETGQWGRVSIDGPIRGPGHDPICRNWACPIAFSTLSIGHTAVPQIAVPSAPPPFHTWPLDVWALALLAAMPPLASLFPYQGAKCGRHGNLPNCRVSDAGGGEGDRTSHNSAVWLVSGPSK